MQLLRTLLIIVLVYYGLKILARIFGPSLFRYASKKTAQRYDRGFGQQRNEPYQKQKEGEVSIDKQPSPKTSGNRKVGEYIDFEEIDEPKKSK